MNTVKENSLHSKYYVFLLCFSFHMIILGPSFQKILRQFKRIWALLSTQFFHFGKQKFSHFCFPFWELLATTHKILCTLFMCLFSTTLPSSKYDLRQLTKIHIHTYSRKVSKENRAKGRV